jgi:hypothetical protein
MLMDDDAQLLKNLYKLESIEKVHQTKPDTETALEVEAHAQSLLPDGIHPEIEATKTLTLLEVNEKRAKMTKTKELKFYFHENELFENKILSIIIHFENGHAIKSVSDKIIWKEGKNRFKMIGSI